MKILLTGTHGTGKSTLCSELIKQPEFADFNVANSSTREGRDLGLQINKLGEVDTQYYCMSKDVLNLITYRDKDTIFDRSIIDTYVYTHYLYLRALDNNQHPGFSWDRILSILDQLLIEYRERNYFDHIIWLRPEFPLANDGVRDGDVAFQVNVDYAFEMYFRSGNWKFNQVSGSVEERVECIKSLIK